MLKAYRAGGALLQWGTEATKTSVTLKAGEALTVFNCLQQVQHLPGSIRNTKTASLPGALPIHYPHTIPRQSPTIAAVPRCA